MAPFASVFPLSGITRFKSKSIVFPNPWQSGQAPKGLLKEKRRGSGFLVGNLAVLALEPFAEDPSSATVGLPYN